MTGVRVIQVHPDGRVFDGPLPGPTTMDGLYEALSCRTYDVIRLTDGIDMWVDDEGAINGSDVNLAASIIANRCGHPHAILFGAAVLAAGNEDGDTVGLTDEQAATIVRVLAPQADDGTADRIRAALVAAYPYGA